MTNTPMTVINLRLPTSQLHAIKNVAENDDLTTTQFIRRIIKKYMQENNIPPIDNDDYIKPEIKAYFDKNKPSNTSDLMK